MTTKVTIFAGHGWPVDVVSKAVGTGEELSTLRVDIDKTESIYVHAGVDLFIHEVQPDELGADNYDDEASAAADLADAKARSEATGQPIPNPLIDPVVQIDPATNQIVQDTPVLDGVGQTNDGGSPLLNADSTGGVKISGAGTSSSQAVNTNGPVTTTDDAADAAAAAAADQAAHDAKVKADAEAAVAADAERIAAEQRAADALAAENAAKQADEDAAAAAQKEADDKAASDAAAAQALADADAAATQKAADDQAAIDKQAAADAATAAAAATGSSDGVSAAAVKETQASATAASVSGATEIVDVGASTAAVPAASFGTDPVDDEGDIKVTGK